MNFEGGRVICRPVTVLGVGLVLALVAIATVASLADPARGAAPRRDGALPAGWTTTESGPLSPADRDLLVRVRLAGLWEAPAGQMAQDRSSNERVRTVGHHLATDHLALDEQVRAVAARLGVELPAQPNADQQSWLAEMSVARSADFDRVFADRLRVAHGKVFSVVAAVRAATRNDVMRAFAQTAVTVVMKHMTLLESTGMVDYDALPTAAAGPAPAAAAAGFPPRSGGTVHPNVIWLVLGLAMVTGLVTAARVIRPR